MPALASYPDRTLTRTLGHDSANLVGKGKIITALPQGRLTLTANTPVMTVDATAQTTIRYTPYFGRYVPLYNGTDFYEQDIGGELTQATTDGTKSPAAVTTNSNYDLFVWNDSGTIRCTRGPAWTSDTARGTGAGTTELALTNGINLNANAITNGPGALAGTYVGTVRSNASSQIDWQFGTVASGTQQAMLGVWNAYNRIDVGAAVADATATWTYATGTWRSLNGSDQNRISMVRGLNEDGAQIFFQTRMGSPGAGFHALGVGYDSTTVPSQQPNGVYNFVSGANFDAAVIAVWTGQPGLGLHFFQAIEIGDGTNAWTIYGATYMSMQMQAKA